MQSQSQYQSPYGLVVRTPRCGRSKPGSTPGEGMCAMTWASGLIYGSSPGKMQNLGRDDVEVFPPKEIAYL